MSEQHDEKPKGKPGKPGCGCWTLILLIMIIGMCSIAGQVGEIFSAVHSNGTPVTVTGIVASDPIMVGVSDSSQHFLYLNTDDAGLKDLPFQLTKIEQIGMVKKGDSVRITGRKVIVLERLVVLVDSIELIMPAPR